MVYDEGLADRIRAALPALAGGVIEERKMFGGIAFMLEGHLCCGIAKGELLVRLGPVGAREALSDPHAHPMEFTGRPMRSMILVRSDALGDAELQDWVDRAVEFTRGLDRRTPG